MFMVPSSHPRPLAIPEPDATANVMVLGEHETTGPLAVGFEFERFGVRYDHFDLSTDGFVRFGNDPYRGGRGGSLRLDVSDPGRLGGGRLAYEVRGSAPRRRLVVSFAGQGADRPTLHLVVYERTGIVGVREVTGQSLGDPTMRQLDIAHPEVSRVNSARKIG